MVFETKEFPFFCWKLQYHWPFSWKCACAQFILNVRRELSSCVPVGASSRLLLQWPSQNQIKMKAGRIFLFEFSILFTILSATIFNIERQLIATQNGTLSKDLFTNPGGCSRSSICTNLKGVCHNPTGGVVGHCCVCECRNEQNLFYSLRNGCTTSKDAIKRTQIAGIHFVRKGCGAASNPLSDFAVSQMTIERNF